MAFQVYDFIDYRHYLKAYLSDKRGRIGEIAEFLNCQSSFISQVVTMRTHLSLEHAFKIGKFVSFSKDELEYFILLVQIERAGSVELKEFFEEKKENLISKRKLVKERIAVTENIKSSHQAIYYSNWWYAAVHILVAFPKYQTFEAIQKKLNLAPLLIENILHFLLTVGLILENNGRYNISKKRIHLDQDSPFITNHHVHWRTKAIQMIGNSNREDLNYSALVGISNEDYKILKKQVLDLIEKSEKTVQTSQEEDVFLFNLDLFRFR